MKLSPMMQQYMDIKHEYADCILFFRLGDFYEMFFDDAKLVSRLLELTLTGKSCGLEERAPMCGVPFHAADTYIDKLVSKGYNVAICEQLEDPATTKGMVKRGVIRVVTPGTVTSAASLEEKENNYIAAISSYHDVIGLSYCDITTGELKATEITLSPSSFDDMISELVKINVKEVIISPEINERFGESEIASQTDSFVRTMSGSYFEQKSCTAKVRSRFGDVSLTALGLEGRPSAVMAAGGLLTYIMENQKQELEQIRTCDYVDLNDNMALDKATIRNLEITETLYEKKTDGSLLGVLDRTCTAMGGREIRSWLREPLKNKHLINERLDSVGYFYDNELVLNDLREALKGVYDFERLAGRIASGGANARDMIALRDSILELPEIKDILLSSEPGYLKSLGESISDLSQLGDMIGNAIKEDPPLTVTEGDLIRDGFSDELDELKASIHDATTWIAGLESSEKERTGITHLKVGYNKVFGYYIEISKSNLDMVPEDYIRKQTLVGAERFITPKLKEMESKVLSAEAKINKLEYDIFTGLREEAGRHIDEIQSSSRAIARADVLASFASCALRSGYTRPVVDDSLTIEIEKGRHPVIEHIVNDGSFVSNDTYMDGERESMLLITGPNMAGKSTYMRQTALIILMAQAGSFVPADYAHIGVCDRIFTRIGASDNLAQGQSTFFVEMSELAYIMRNAGKRSFVILDEIGRGTSTYDGLSIAWSTVEQLAGKDVKIRTMFATHYHELTVLEDKLGSVRNLTMDVAEENGSIVFLHKIVPGYANKSYGIHVARLAGVPGELLENAEIKLSRLEDEDSQNEVKEAFTSDGEAGSKSERPEQISFFSPGENPAIEKLKALDLMDTKPSEAFRILEELKALADKENGE